MVETILRERLATGIAIIMVTHPEQAARLGHRHFLHARPHLRPADVAAA